MVFQLSMQALKSSSYSLRSESPLAWLGNENYLNWHAPHLREKTWCGCPNRWLSKLQHWRYMERNWTAFHVRLFNHFEYYRIFYTCTKDLAEKSSFKILLNGLGFRLLVPSTFAAVRPNRFHLWDLTFIESMSLLGFPLSSYVHLFNDDVHAMAHHTKSKGPALHQGLGSDHLGDMVMSVWGWWWWWWWRWWWCRHGKWKRLNQ